MIDQSINQAQQANQNSINKWFAIELFEKIKQIQSLPDDTVLKFLQSKGKLKKKSDAINFEIHEK